MSQQGASEDAQARRFPACRGAYRVRPEQQVLASQQVLAQASPLMVRAVLQVSQRARRAKLRPPDELALPPAPQSWEVLAAQPRQSVAPQKREPAQGRAEEQEMPRA